MSELTAACSGRDLDGDAWPTVSVILAIRNEVLHLERAVVSVLDQDYPREFDVCLAVAPSDDGTAELADRLAAQERRVSAVPNPAGITPAGLNAAIAATKGEVIVRVDGHAELSPGYIRRAVETMCRTGAVNVGGRQVPQPQSPFEEAVAVATTSWLGTGGATYRVGGTEGPVDTVFLGVFDRRAGDDVGWFDERLIRNQDYELNVRLREAGGTVWFDPELWAAYRPRGSLGALALQYFEYGFWKAEVVRRHPRSMRLRQLIAAVAPVAVVLSAAGAAARPRLLVGPVAYVTAVLAAAIKSARSRPGVARRLTAVLPTQHASWSAGFAVGAWRALTRPRHATAGLSSTPARPSDRAV